MPDKHQLCICVKNEGYEASLELRKIYESMADAEAKGLGQIRVIDESGEDYLYPEDFFVQVQLPAAIEAELMKSM